MVDLMEDDKQDAGEMTEKSIQLYIYNLYILVFAQ